MDPFIIANPVWLIQFLDQLFALLALQDVDNPRVVGGTPRIGEQDLIAGAQHHEAWNVEVLGPLLHVETGRHAELGAGWLWNHFRTVGYRLGGIRRRQLGVLRRVEEHGGGGAQRRAKKNPSQVHVCMMPRQGPEARE
jgi:hypothetical protein